MFSSIKYILKQLNRLIWSLYFIFTIMIFGSLFGYIMTFFLFVIGRVIGFLSPSFSRIFLDWTERFYTSAIRGLLLIQPWLKCKTNIPSLLNLNQYYQTHCQTKRLLFVANHRSNLDTFLMISWIPGLRGLAKSTLYYNFIFAPFMWITGFIPVKKGSANSFMDGLQKLRTRLLEKEIPVLIFPENTRCEKGAPKLNKWSQSVFKMALDAKATIIPVAIKNTDSLLGKGDLMLNPFEPIEVKMLPPVETSHYFDSQVLSKDIHFLLEQELA